MATQSYIVAIGSNRRGRHGAPDAEVRAALSAIGVRATAAIIVTAPVGPSIRRFANTVSWIDSDERPRALLARLKRIERDFGRRRGRRWRARVIDLDIVWWSGGTVRSRVLTIPHPSFRERAFVLAPLARIAPDLRDPVTHRTVRQLHARLTRKRPLRTAQGPGAGP